MEIAQCGKWVIKELLPASTEGYRHEIPVPEESPLSLLKQVAWTSEPPFHPLWLLAADVPVVFPASPLPTAGEPYCRCRTLFLRHRWLLGNPFICGVIPEETKGTVIRIRFHRGARLPGGTLAAGSSTGSSSDKHSSKTAPQNALAQL